jgi:hypothetical protein
MVDYHNYLLKIYPNTKARIIALLSISAPLSARETYHKIRCFGVTYHAIYKALHELVISNILSKQGNLYSIRQEYCTQLIEQIRHIKGGTIPPDIAFTEKFDTVIENIHVLRKSLRGDFNK